jgi:hypothetical protein
MTDRRPFGEEWVKRHRLPWWYLTPVSITKPAPGVLRVAKSRTLAGLSAVLLAAFVLAWYGVFAAMVRAEDSQGVLEGAVALVRARPWMAVFLLAPLLAAPGLARNLWRLITGDVIVFDGGARSIVRNGRVVGWFDGVTQVEVRSASRGEAGMVYTVSLRHHRKGVIRIAQLSDIDDASELASALADILSVGVTETNS